MWIHARYVLSYSQGHRQGRHRPESGQSELISDERLFEAYVRVNGFDEKLNAGAFILTPSMTMVEIVETLQHSEAASVTIVIPEGWRREQVADYLAAAGVFTNTATVAEDYRRQTATSDLTLGLRSRTDISFSKADQPTPV